MKNNASKVAKKSISLGDLYKEVRALRRDIAAFIPTESFNDYKNKKEIMEAHREARALIGRPKQA